MTQTLTNFRAVAGPQAGRPRTIHRSNTEQVGPEAYPVPLDVVIDLRRDDERERVPHPLADRVDYRSVPLFDPSSAVESGDDAIQLEEQYIDWLERHRVGIAQVFTSLAQSTGSVLVCCSAGKDRTGIVSALLSDLWGCSLNEIGADYAATGPALAERFAAERARSTDLEFTLIQQRCTPEIAVAVIDHVRTTYGGAAGYLARIGLTPQQIASL